MHVTALTGRSEDNIYSWCSFYTWIVGIEFRPSEKVCLDNGPSLSISVCHLPRSVVGPEVFEFRC